ncbi:hypothetical protein [Pseudobdellovibrio sp. HCB154]|uniref:hypothetical protein n=1 Tax=Pseudobdellovibrio sp. HCB154 TaxID=3386277 RepID=UPI003916E98B
MIKIDAIYDKNLNFLLGSGASFGLLPTLALQICDANAKKQTIETLATEFTKENKDYLKTLLFMYYYRSCIQPALALNVDTLTGAAEKKVIENYEVFLKKILHLLARRKTSVPSCNIFTTNYDGCVPLTADRIIKEGSLTFNLNDGTEGFGRKLLHAKNFSTFKYQTGVFGEHRVNIPQINLIHIHGSVYWKKSNNDIQVNYTGTLGSIEIPAEYQEDLNTFSELVNNNEKTTQDLYSLQFTPKDTAWFWNEFNKLPIVNPTKWKFHETVFEEHYYQMLRLLSYELEKENSIFITFGFSFADEHILKLVQRSLSNPKLQVFICCFNENEKNQMFEYFGNYRNVTPISIDENLDFSKFNSDVLKHESAEA